MATYYIVKETNGGNVKRLHRQDISEDSEAIITALGLGPKWFPPSIPLGGLLTTDSGFYINDSGAGLNLRLFGNSDSTMYHNDTLNRDSDSPVYDGSDLAVKLHLKLRHAPGTGDEIGFIISFAFIKDGDDASIEKTTLEQSSYPVDSYTVGEKFEITLPTMTGEVDATTILLTIERNATGAQADSYNGDVDVLSLNFEKVQ